MPQIYLFFNSSCTEIYNQKTFSVINYKFGVNYAEQFFKERTK